MHNVGSTPHEVTSICNQQTVFGEQMVHMMQQLQWVEVLFGSLFCLLTGKEQGSENDMRYAHA